MIPQTQNPVIPLIEVEGRLADGRFVVRYQGQKVAATEAQLLAIHREREEQIARMVEDPWRYGWLNPAWERADAARLADILSGLELRSTEDLARLEQERNEARAVADELASVAAHCLGWHDHESPDAAIKIAAALKRWKKNK